MWQKQLQIFFFLNLLTAIVAFQHNNQWNIPTDCSCFQKSPCGEKTSTILPALSLSSDTFLIKGEDMPHYCFIQTSLYNRHYSDGLIWKILTLRGILWKPWNLV